MSSPSANDKRRKEGNPRAAGGGMVLWWLMALAVAAAAGFWFKPRPQNAGATHPSVSTSTNAPTTNATSTVVATAPAPEKLIGGWIRPDGGYLLEIRSVHADGRADVAYFNPRSINVARAEWKRDAGQLRLFVEFRDVNYPGSTYRLALSPNGQQLAGVYHQAVQGQDFDVQFMRER